MTREEVIAYGNDYYRDLTTACCEIDEKHKEFVRMAIQALSQEPCTDAVSREAVLKIIDGWYEQNRDTENIEDLIILITYMNSVQPKTVSSDVVSKTEVKRIVDFYKEQYDGIYHINESIEKLPSVTQKSGHWIYDRTRDWDGECKYECSECGMGSDVDYAYCMRCGAKMVEPQESEE